MIILKLVFSFYILCLCFGVLAAVVRFFADVMKWHDKEIMIEQIPSNESSVDHYAKACEIAVLIMQESEVNNDVDTTISDAYNAGESGQSDTSAFFTPGM